MFPAVDFKEWNVTFSVNLISGRVSQQTFGLQQSEII